MTPKNLVVTRLGTELQDMEVAAIKAPQAEVIEMQSRSAEFSLAELPCNQRELILVT